MKYIKIEKIFKLGSKLILRSHDESFTGILEELDEDDESITIKKDNGKILIIKCEKIEEIQEVEDFPDIEVKPVPNVTDTLKSAMQELPKKILQTDLIYLPQLPPVKFVHREDIKNYRRESQDSEKMHSFYAEWNQIDSIFESAKKNKSLAEKQNLLLRRLKDFINTYPQKLTYILAGDVYAAYEQWEMATSFYVKAKLYPEAVNCALKIEDNKNLIIDVLRTQISSAEQRTPDAWRMFFLYVADLHYHKITAELLEKVLDTLTESEREIVCQGGYKIIADSDNTQILNWSKFDCSPRGIRQLIDTLKQVGKDDSEFIVPKPKIKQISNSDVSSSDVKKGKITFFNQEKNLGYINNGAENVFFHLSQVEEEKLRAALNKFGIWRENIKVRYILAQGENGSQADHIFLTEDLNLSKEFLEIHDGILYFYDPQKEFGKVRDNQTGYVYDFRTDTILDFYLKRYLQDLPEMDSLADKSNIEPPLNVQFTLKGYRNRAEIKIKRVVRNLILTKAELEKLSAGYGLATPNFRPILNADEFTNLLPYKSLPPIEEKSDSQIFSVKKIAPPPVNLFDNRIHTPKIYTPIQELPNTYKEKSRYFERGERLYLIEKNYSEAAKCFEIAIQDENFFDKSFKRLMTIAKIDYGEDMETQIDKALGLLQKYESRLDPNTVINERIELFAKAKRKEELIAALVKGIENSPKLERRLHYLKELAREYRLKEDYAAAIECYETWLKEKKRYSYKLSPQMNYIELNIKENMATCLYLEGNKKRAKEIAAELLKISSNNLMALNIMEDQMPTEDIIQEEDYEEGTAQLSPYITDYVLNEITLEQIFSTAYHRIFRGKFENVFNGNNFNGSEDDAKRIIKDIRISLDEASDKQRSEAWAFMLKLISCIKNPNFEIDKKNKSVLEQECAAQVMGYAGDAELQQQLDCNIDVVRFFYEEEMNLLPRGSRFEYRTHVVKFFASFFLKPNEVQMISRNSTTRNIHLECLDKEYTEDDAQKLLVSTFLFSDRIQKIKDINNEFIEAMASRPQWCIESEKLFGKLLNSPVNLNNEKSFKKFWQEAKKIYLKKRNELNKTLRDGIVQYENLSDDTIDTYAEKILELLENTIPSETDRKHVKNYCELLENMRKTVYKSTFEDKEDGYKEILSKSEDFIKDICDHPTKLSYEVLKNELEGINFKADAALKNLYETSIPKLNIETNISSMSEPVQFIVTIENEENCQTAGNMEVSVESINEEISIKPKNADKKIIALRGGKRLEFLYEAELSSKEQAQGYFEIKVSISYQYRVAIDDTTKTTISKDGNISLEEYEPIDNIYSGQAYSHGLEANSNLFYGRDEEINNIVATLKLPNGDLLKHREIIMYGQKRSGKSSIMNQLKQKIQNTYGHDAYVIIEVGSVGGYATFFGFISKILSEWKKSLKNNHAELYKFLEENNVEFPNEKIESKDYTDDQKNGMFERALSNIIEKTAEFSQSENKYIPLFFIDEFTYIYQWLKEKKYPDNFMKFWKKIFQDYPLCAIMIGLDHMPQFIKEYANEFACTKTILVSFLKENHATALADEPMRLKNGLSRYKKNKSADDDPLTYIYRLTAGSAFLIVIFCDEFVNYLNERKIKYITKIVIDNFIKEKLFELPPLLGEKEFDAQINDPGKFDTENKNTYFDNKVVLTYIARHCDKVRHEIDVKKISCISELSVKTAERQSTIINQLLERRVLNKRNVDGVEYLRIEIELLRMWLLREEGIDF